MVPIPPKSPLFHILVLVLHFLNIVEQVIVFFDLLLQG